MKPICIYVATGNAHKVLEIGRFFETHGLNHVTVKSAKEAGGMPHVDENADTFEGNALLKAKALKEKVGKNAYVLADDSGIEVDALDGAPGIFSARYAGESGNDQANNEKLMRELTDIPDAKRTAHYVCALVLLKPDGEEEFFSDICEGRLLREPHGNNGFGYDPYFVPNGYDKTFGELAPTIKDNISHRARALKLLVDFLKD